MNDDEIKGEIIEALKNVNDPETNMSVYDMDLIKDLKAENGKITLKFSPSSNVCPLAIQLAFNIKRAVESVEGVCDVDLTVTNYVAADRLNQLLKK
jgi:ATP-binding protein involved in chromosome partitioning